MKLTEQIVIQHNQEHGGSLSNTTVIRIPPTMAEHNVMMELLKHIRREFPGVWYCVKEWERTEYPTRIGVPAQTEQMLAKVKEVSREHLGLPKNDEMGDVPL